MIDGKKTDTEMIEEFITNKNTHETQLIIDFAKAILDCEIQKKEIQNNIKDIKASAKDESIQVKQVMSAVAAMKKELKTPDIDKKETQEMYDILYADSDIRFKIDSLVSKD